MKTSETAAYVLAIITAIWFGLVGWRTKTGGVFWAISGAIIALILSTVCLGFANSITVPYSAPAVQASQRNAIIASAILIALFAATITYANIRRTFTQQSP
jgi:hypothetical protein